MRVAQLPDTLLCDMTRIDTGELTFNHFYSVFTSLNFVSASITSISSWIMFHVSFTFASSMQNNI